MIFRILFILSMFFAAGVMQGQEAVYSETAANALNADEYGMKKYVFCLLKSGPNTPKSTEESATLFDGHMAVIHKLADQGKLSVAGPFMKNDRNYRGIYIFNVETVEEAIELTKEDPAVKAGLLEPEFTVLYCSAALQTVNDVHKTIQKTKM